MSQQRGSTRGDAHGSTSGNPSRSQQSGRGSSQGRNQADGHQPQTPGPGASGSGRGQPSAGGRSNNSQAQGSYTGFLGQGPPQALRQAPSQAPRPESSAGSTPGGRRGEPSRSVEMPIRKQERATQGAITSDETLAALANPRMPSQSVIGGGYQSPPQGDTYQFPKNKIPDPSQNVRAKENTNVGLNAKVTSTMLQERGIEIPLRTSYGTSAFGSSTLASNYFHLQAEKGIVLYRYSISIKPKDGSNKDLPYRVRRRLLCLLLLDPCFHIHGHAIATDYNGILITRKKISDEGEDRKVVPIRYWEKEEGAPRAKAPEYDVALTLAESISMQDLQAYLDADPTAPAANYNKDAALAALNIIITKHPSTTDGVYAFYGNTFFNYPVDKRLDECLNLGGGLIAVRGYYSSARTSTARLLINAHNQTSAFYPQTNVRDLMKLHGEEDHGALEAFLRRLKIKTNYTKSEDRKKVIVKVKTITKLSGMDAKNQMIFDTENQRQVSVEDFFRRRHEVRLKHPGAKLLEIGTYKTETNGKTVETSIWLPPELASIMPGQIYRNKLSPDQTKFMIAYAARPPAENARRLMEDGLRTLGLTEDNLILKAFGLFIDPKTMVTVSAQQLNTPPSKNKIEVKAGYWKMGKEGFTEPSKIFRDAPKSKSPWSVVLIEENQGPTTDKVKMLTSKSLDYLKETLKNRGLGERLPNSREIVKIEKSFTSAQKDSVIRDFLTKAKKEGALIVLVILPNKDAELYSRLKYLADCRIGIHTVCSTSEKFNLRKEFSPGKLDPDMTIYSNLALKINSKLGGVNYHIDERDFGLFGKDTMVVGVDVTHPSPSSIEEMPSIAAVVASVDDKYSLWPGSMRLQAQYKPDPEKPGKPREMVQYMEVMILERLDAYKERNRKLPKQILVYRDGVSESQYDAVLEQEYPGILTACKKRYATASSLPSISILVVTKRHHTRFYPGRDEDSDLVLKKDGRVQGNPKPGTVVDRGITMDRGFDFFLQAHRALQGTAKPAHYICIKDGLQNKNRSADEYQKFSHVLSYHFARAATAVSYCTPAYYADFLAERGRVYLHEYYNATPEARKEKFNWTRSPWVQGSTPHPDLAKSMFYL